MDEGHLDPFRNSDYETKTSQVKSTGFLLSFLNIACIHWSDMLFLLDHGATQKSTQYATVRDEFSTINTQKKSVDTRDNKFTLQ